MIHVHATPEFKVIRASAHLYLAQGLTDPSLWRRRCGAPNFEEIHTHNYEKIVKIFTAKTGYYLSQTTSTHCNMASQFADVTISPSE